LVVRPYKFSSLNIHAASSDYTLFPEKMLISLGPLGEQTIGTSLLLLAGLVTITWYTVNFIRVLLSTFILPGTSVRLLPSI